MYIKYYVYIYIHTLHFGININYVHICRFRVSLVAWLVKNPPSMQEIWVQFLGCKDPLEKGMPTYFSILAWRTQLPEKPGRMHP